MNELGLSVDNSKTLFSASGLIDAHKPNVKHLQTKKMEMVFSDP